MNGVWFTFTNRHITKTQIRRILAKSSIHINSVNILVLEYTGEADGYEHLKGKCYASPDFWQYIRFVYGDFSRRMMFAFAARAIHRAIEKMMSDCEVVWKGGEIIYVFLGGWWCWSCMESEKAWNQKNF